MSEQSRYCWLTNDYEFSNSWDEEDHEHVDQDMIDRADKMGWKLIKYECLNDEDFEFMHHMKMK